MANDGLTDAQRDSLRESFANGIGKRPDPAEFKREADEIALVLAQREARCSRRFDLDDVVAELGIDESA